MKALLLVPVLLGMATHYFIDVDNTSRNQVVISEIMGLPQPAQLEHTTFVPLLSILWLVASLALAATLINFLIKRHTMLRACIVALAFNVAVILFPNRWYPPPLKTSFPSNLKWLIDG